MTRAIRADFAPEKYKVPLGEEDFEDFVKSEGKKCPTCPNALLIAKTFFNECLLCWLPVQSLFIKNVPVQRATGTNGHNGPNGHMVSCRFLRGLNLIPLTTRPLQTGAPLVKFTISPRASNIKITPFL